MVRFKLFSTLLLTIIISSCSNSQNVKTLEINENWQFRKSGDSDYLNAIIPGSVQSNLLRLNKIPDPFVGMNEKDIQSIENENWEFRNNFSMSHKQLEKEYIELKFNGLDTYSEVYLNGHLILETDNMFRHYRVNIKKLAQEKNTLVIKFYSPIQKVLPKYLSLPYQLPASNDMNKQKVSTHVRKAPSHFGWDWGPRIVTMGIWQPIELITYDKNQITNLNIVQSNHSNDKVDLSINIETTNELNLNDKFRITIQDDSTKTTSEWSAGSKHQISIKKPKYWWTHNLGKPHLYNVTLELMNENQIIDTYEQKLGIRTIELIREPDSYGTSFYFKLNGKPVYMKGANTIPQDALLSRVTDEKREKLFEDAKESNMNMLRVWGGGIYQPDQFYDLADKYGIMIWQDFMFACSMYPGDEQFMKTVSIEIEQQIKRLRHHASLALWCGNNEVEVAWNNWGWQLEYGLSKSAQDQIWSDYKKLFQKLIPNKIDSLNNTTPYISTSPLSNWGTAENFNHHNMHYWGVWHGEDNFEEFKNNVPRFMAEYGFQSFPELETIKQFSDSTQFDLDSDVMKWHQKSYKGNRLLLHHLKQYYDEPNDFDDFIYKNQLTQAKAIEMAIDAHRMNMPKNMGTLFWQMNDNWPGPTWSGIDFYGRWKAMQYRVKDAYNPIRIIFDVKDNDIDIYVISESEEDLSTYILNLYLIHSKGKGIEVEPEFVKRTHQHVLLFKINKNLLYESKGFDKNSSLLLADLFTKNSTNSAKATYDEESTHLSSRLFYFVKPNQFKEHYYYSLYLKKKKNSTEITFSPSSKQSDINSNQGIYLKLKDHPNAHFSDNYFDLVPFQLKSISVNKIITKDDLIIKTLND